MCGLIADYNLAEPTGIKLVRSLLTNRVKLQGFIVSDRSDLYLRAVTHLAKWVALGKIKYHETVARVCRTRPKPSSACSRAQTSASNWSSWSETARKGSTMDNIVITGSNSGFGRLTAELLAKAGHTVYATMRESTTKNAKAATELKAVSAANGNRGRVVDLDVTSDASVQQAIDTIAKQSGGIIDVLYNNAGRFSGGVQEAYTVEEVKAVFEVNVFGPLRVNRAVLPLMRKRGSGLIIAISSIVGRFPAASARTRPASSRSKHWPMRSATSCSRWASTWW